MVGAYYDTKHFYGIKNYSLIIEKEEVSPSTDKLR